jgi:hypothetical protein
VEDREVRRRAIVALAVLLAAFITGCGHDYDDGAGTYTTTPAPTAGASASAATTPTPAGPTPAPAERLGEDPEPSAGAPGAQLSPAQRRAEAAARGAARAFLTGYLPYTYGLARASAIRAAGARLRAQLDAEPPRVPPAQRRGGRHAKLAALQTAAIEARRVTMVATVDDGGNGYGALLTVEPDAHDDWRVTEVR